MLRTPPSLTHTPLRSLLICMQLRPVARRPAGLALKHAAKATVPNRASSNGLRPLLPRISHSSSAPLPASCSVRRMGRCSCPPAPRTKARDEAEREPQQAPAKQGEDQAPAERKPPVPRQRSMAYRLFADLYVCAYVCSYRIGELIVVNAQEGLERLRRYVRDNFFNQKR